MIVKSGLQTLFALALASSLTVYVSTKTLGQAGGRANGVELPVPRQDPEPKTKVICTSVGGSHLIDTTLGVHTAIPMYCCPKGEFVEDPINPLLDKDGNLRCVKET